MAASSVAFVGTGKVKTNDTLGTWIAQTGSPSLALNTTNFIEGTGSLSEKVSATTLAAYSITAADWTGEPWNFSSGGGNDGEHIFVWMTAYEGWDTLANGGFRIIAADDLATDSRGVWYVGPQPGYLGGWYSYVINPGANFNEVTAGTANWTTNGNPAQLTGVDGFGFGWKITKSITGNVDNAFADCITVGRGYRITLGDAGSAEGKFSDFATFEETNRFGPLRSQSGILFPRCKLYIGADAGATNTEFIDSNFTVVWEQAVLSDGTSSAVASTFYELAFSKGTGSTTVQLSNGSLSSVSPHEVYLNFTGSTSATLTNVNATRARLIDVDGAVTWTGGQINQSGLMTLTGTATLSGLSFLSGTDSAALQITNNTYLNNVDNLSFTSGGTGHGIEITATGSYDFNDIFFSGYAGTDGSTGNECVYNNSGGAVTINVIGGTTPTVRNSAGSSTTIVANTATTTITVVDATSGAAVQSARVLVYAANGTGPLPFDETVTITRSGSTATVSHTAHGIATGKKVMIKGANQQEYNGVFTISVVDANSYTYTVSGTPATPATGTIKATGVVLEGTTDVNGQISDTRTWSTNQPITGRARKATGGTLYKTGTVSGTVDTAAGFSATIQLIRDQ